MSTSHSDDSPASFHRPPATTPCSLRGEALEGVLIALPFEISRSCVTIFETEENWRWIIACFLFWSAWVARRPLVVFDCDWSGGSAVSVGVGVVGILTLGVIVLYLDVDLALWWLANIFQRTSYASFRRSIIFFWNLTISIWSCVKKLAAEENRRWIIALFFLCR